MTDVPAAGTPPLPRSFSIRPLVLPALALLTGIAAQAGLPGSILALLPLALLVLLCTPLRWAERNPAFKLLLVLAAGVTIAIAIEPGPLNLAMAWLTLAMLALMARGGSLHNMLASFLSLLGQLIVSPAESARAVERGRAAARAALPARFDLRMAVLPALSVLVFTLLFMTSNTAFAEVIAALFDIKIDWLWVYSGIVALLVLQCLFAITVIKTSTISSAGVLEAEAPSWHETLFSPGTVIVTLAALNGLFLIQNLLDAQYLWSGVLGTPGNGYAQYAQKGAFTLIITVLLAAGLIIISLWPGSRTNASPAVRLLVYLWILQNGFLLASCTARLWFYVEAYGLTLWRLSSLIWMGLIACGLVLVALRIVLSRSNLWLVNANLTAGFLVLWASGFADFAAVVANHNAAWGLRTGHYDTAYMASLGPSALPALHRLADAYASGTPPRLWIAGDHIAQLTEQLRGHQSHWQTWTLRGALIAYRLPDRPNGGITPAY
ncbi:MAG: DUF4173 domain-containing protein [Aestuariivirga sp.]|uniref:DUF4153 domain-containing protein n=1 Tax=Aestuariivirga sp. TaxID=2650926 RepID=UPI0025B9A457|nr:DUF4173 domain-containing protein [Aestuariivirga sp.]MCA3561979.1 DUF4173 domain-containing protein [Aestuariivirga sp.]